VWAKISTSATAIACAACLAASAATLPAVEKAGSDLARTADVKLAVDLSQLAGFDAIPAYISLLSGGGVDALSPLASVNALTTFFGTGGVFTGGGLDALLADGTPGFDALSALAVFFGSAGVFGTGGVDALSNYAALSAIPAVLNGDLSSLDSVSAIPPYIALAGGDITATGDLASVSAVDTFFGNGPAGQDGTPIGGVFTGGGIDALAPAADGSGGYAALSALPVFFGPDTSGNAPFGPGLFTGGGVDALKNYAALSTIPALVDDPTTHSAPMALTPFAAAAQKQAAPQAASLAAQATIAQDPGSTTPTTPTAGSNPVNTFVASLPKPQAFTPPAPQALTPPAPTQVDPTVTTPDKGGNRFNGSYSKKFEPTTTSSDSPFLLESGTPGGEGMRGYGSFLKKLGIGGGGAADGAGAATGTK
jgi:hypothetical protein